MSSDATGHRRRGASIDTEGTRLWPRALLLIGSIGPLGHLPASGTVTVALVGIPLAWLMRIYLTTVPYIIVVAVFAFASMWLHQVGDRLLGEKDSRKLVWDELAGFFVAAAIIPWTWPIVACTFFIQRGLDISKVPPANWIERRVPGGVGVVGDDLVAGAYTLAIMKCVTVWAEAYPTGGSWLGIGG